MYLSIHRHFGMCMCVYVYMSERKTRIYNTNCLQEEEIAMVVIEDIIEK